MRRSYSTRLEDEDETDEIVTFSSKRGRRTRKTDEANDGENEVQPDMSSNVLYERIMSEIVNREIGITDVLNLKLSMDDYVWFVENIRIMDSMDKNCTERLKLKNLVYEKYIEFKNTDFSILDKIKKISDFDDNMIDKILKSNHPDTVKSILYKKYKMCNDFSEGSYEITKTIEWIDTVLNLPCGQSLVSDNSSVDVLNYIETLWNTLNEKVYGLHHVKERVLEFMCPKVMSDISDVSKGKIILLVGPPGVGKTATAASIAKSLNLPFEQIAFGSVKDSSMLTGFSSTYIGSVPGLFTKILLKMKQLNGVILLDELDKISSTQEGKSISSVLLHILDRTQNSKFRDMYMPEIDIDLSKIIFCGAANSIDDIDPILLNRMEIIHIKGYTVEEKIQIVVNHTSPRILTEMGLTSDQIFIEGKELQYFILEKTDEQPGMRDVEMKLVKMFEKILLLNYSGNIPLSYKCTGFQFPCKITKKLIDKLC